MGQRIDQFCEDLRLKLTSIDDSMHELKAGIDTRNAAAEKRVQERLDAVQARIDDRHQHVVDANNRVKAWAETKKLTTEAEIAGWKRQRETARLEKRAQEAEAYADAASDIAVAAVDEAEAAALEAWLARLDADLAAGK